jgi:DNA-binding transcriptional ArsR family regulator
MSLEVAPDPAETDAAQQKQGVPDPDRPDHKTATLRALAHPIRLRIMSLLTAAELTAADVARELSMNHANASYHLRQLHAAGAIELAGEERIRGGIAKRYRYDCSVPQAPADRESPGESPGESPAEPSAERRRAQRALYATLAQELRRRAGHLRLGHNKAHMTDAELWVAPEVWEKVRVQVTEASQLLHSAARPPRTPGAIRVNATIALFEMNPADLASTDMDPAE